MQGKLAQNVRNKFFQDFEKNSVELQQESRSINNSAAVEAMLCGFILEGEVAPLGQSESSVANSSQEWFYKL